MSLRARTRSFLRNLFLRRRVESDLDQEVHSHLEMLADENVRAGLTAYEAARLARIELGGIEQVKEQVREQRIANWLHSVVGDCRYALRQLRKSPGFTTVAILTLALGIGANTAIFSVVENVLLRSLPYRDPSRLVEIWNNYFPQWSQLGLSCVDFQEWREQTKSITEMAAYRFVPVDLNLTGKDETARVEATYATANLFSALGVTPTTGRTFLPEEDRPGSAPVALISHELWQSRFGGNDSVVGKTIELDGTNYSVVGVLPADFRLAPWADVWLPAGLMDATELNSRVHHPYAVVARLAPGATLAQAQAEMTTLAGQQAFAHPATNVHWSVSVARLRDPSAVKLKDALLLLFGAVGMVLLIACANLVNLLLVRNAERQRQIAVRMALGASRSRLVTQLLTETVLLAFAGGCLGIVLARITLVILVSGSSSIAAATPASLNVWVLGFTFGISVGTGIFCGLLPAFRSATANLADVLKSGSKGAIGAGSAKLRNAFVVGEIALSLMLLAGAGLFLRGFGNLLRVDPGFRPDHLLTMHVSQIAIPPAVYAQMTPAQLNDAQVKDSIRFQQLLKQLQSLPGVKTAAGVTVLPLEKSQRATTRFAIENQPDTEKPPRPTAQNRSVSAEYFSAMGIPLIQGRLFNDGDWTSSNIVISQSMARRFWPHGDANGHRINLCWMEKTPCWSPIVGVVGDVHQFGLDAGATFDIYGAGGWTESMVIRTEGDPASITSAVRAKVHEFDPTLAISAVSTMEQVLSGSLSQQRFLTGLLAAFAVLALLLAAVGIYGVVSYGVSQRTQEIGIRMALGAAPSRVGQLIVCQGLSLAAVGAILGFLGAFALSRLLASMLFEVKPTDPLTLTSVVFLLLITVLVVCYLPARRAARVDPMVALRYE
jgi:putative ABC transport system permease protein